MVGKTKATLATVGILTVVVVGGGASIAAANGNPSGGTATEETDPSFTGSVRAPAEQEGQEVPDGQEQAALQELATISQPQAEAAALGAFRGTVADTELSEENGYVVYSVEVNGSDGSVTEVTVDAGSGKVLAHQAQDASDPQD